MRFLRLPDNGLLINTKDFCSILDIQNRPSGTDIGASSLDLASAIRIGYGYDQDFGEWLRQNFDGCNPQTLVQAGLDDEWAIE